MASLTHTPTTLQEVLAQLNLSQYSQALIEAGYDMLNRFDTENLSMKELTEELKEDVPMLKPHARALVSYLFSQQHQPLLSAPGVAATAAKKVADDIAAATAAKKVADDAAAATAAKKVADDVAAAQATWQAINAHNPDDFGAMFNTIGNTAE